MLGCAGDAAVNERVGRKVGTRLFGGAFECEVWEGCWRRVGREEAVEVLAA